MRLTLMKHATSSRPEQLSGLGLRVHGNQLGPGPGVQLAVELAAASVDHCTYLDDADVDALADAADTTVATLLPGVEFSHSIALSGCRSPARSRVSSH